MEKSDNQVVQNESSDEYEEEELIIQNLRKDTDSITGQKYCLYQGFWVPEFLMKGVLCFQKHFVALDDDLILASCPKSGTTWLKALSFSIVNRHTIPLSHTPLLSSVPHNVVPTLEIDVYNKRLSIVDDFERVPSPRLVCTHVAYESLPLSIKNSSKCRIVYIWRNPMDQAVSLWHFLRRYIGDDNDNVDADEEFFEAFCRGVHLFGPFWDHVLGFWKAKLENPEKKILFVKYEDLKNDTSFQVKRVAEFLGFGFSEEEEKRGVIEEIVEFCSIENMKCLKGNNEGVRLSGVENTSYFRKGQVGDWVNHLTPSMANRMEKLIHEKFKDYSYFIQF